MFFSHVVMIKCTEQRVESLGDWAGRVQLLINGRQQLLPLLQGGDVQDVQSVHIHRCYVCSTQVYIWNTNS